MKTATDDDGSAGVLCPAGKIAVGGGGSAGNNDELQASYPLELDGTVAEADDTPRGWFVAGKDDDITVYVICAG